MIVWQFRAERRHGVDERREQIERRLIALSFFVLAAYVSDQSVLDLLGAGEAGTSAVGIALAAVSLVVMPVLAVMKGRTGRAMGSRALVADAAETRRCTYLSAVLLAGLLLNASVGCWWADPERCTSAWGAVGRAPRACPEVRLGLVPVRLPRVWTLLLIPGGMAAGHVVGYVLAAALGASPTVGSHHGYVGDLFFVAVPLTAAVLVRVFLSGLRDELPPVRFGLLALAQMVLFLSVELLEHSSAGIGAWATLTEPAVLCGLAGQLLVAWLIVLVVRASHQVGLIIRAPRAATPSRAPERHRWGRSVFPCSSVGVSVWSLSRRGPPLAA